MLPATGNWPDSNARPSRNRGWSERLLLARNKHPNCRRKDPPAGGGLAGRDPQTQLGPL